MLDRRGHAVGVVVTGVKARPDADRTAPYTASDDAGPA
jgi:hypothetical protein